MALQNLKGYTLFETDVAAIERIVGAIGGVGGGLGGVSSINSQTGDVVLKTVDGQDLIGPGNIITSGGAGSFGGVATTFSTSILYDLEYRYYTTVRLMTQNDVYFKNITGAVIGGKTTWAIQLNGVHLPDFTDLGTLVGVPLVQENGRIYEVTAWRTVAGYYYELIKGAIGSFIDITKPTLLAASVGDPLPTRITLSWSEPMLGTISPPNAFLVSSHTVTAHTLIDPTHTFLTVTPAFIHNEGRTLTYTQPVNAKMQDVAGNFVDNITGFPITDSITHPTVVLAAVSPDNPTFIELTWDEAMNSAISAPAAFAVSPNGSHPLTVHEFLTPTTTRLITSNSYVAAEVTTLAYTPPATNKMMDAAGSNITLAFTGFPISGGGGSTYSSGNYDTPDTYDL